VRSAAIVQQIAAMRTYAFWYHHPPGSAHRPMCHPGELRAWGPGRLYVQGYLFCYLCPSLTGLSVALSFTGHTHSEWRDHSCAAQSPRSARTNICARDVVGFALTAAAQAFYSRHTKIIITADILARSPRIHFGPQPTHNNHVKTCKGEGLRCHENIGPPGPPRKGADQANQARKQEVHGEDTRHGHHRHAWGSGHDLLSFQERG
jgi:hypothetical protein